MTTRFNAKPRSTFGVSPLPTGFDNLTVPDNLTIPPVGIEDVDVALFELFNSEMSLSVSDESGIKKVPIVFASGEKWAMLKRGKAIRDKQGSLILPLITIGRSNVQQLHSEDQAARGINQQTGDIVIKRRLSSKDRNYQSLVNRLLILNQENVAVNPNESSEQNQLTTMRSTGDMASDPTVVDGGLLAPNKLNNAWEIITIPAPQFFTSNYEVTIWTSYTTHMNQILEGLIASFLPQGNAWKLETKKGYWFVATVDGNLYSSENNFEDMASEERIIKYKFNIKVPGYILASRTPGAPVPIRRYVSSPEVSFNIVDSGVPSGLDDPFLGSDDPTLPSDLAKTRREDQREAGKTKLYPGRDHVSPHDPALLALGRGTEPAKYRKVLVTNKKGEQVTKYLRIKNVNRSTGETTYSSTMDLGDLSIIVVSD